MQNFYLVFKLFRNQNDLLFKNFIFLINILFILNLVKVAYMYKSEYLIDTPIICKNTAPGKKRLACLKRSK